MNMKKMWIRYILLLISALPLSALAEGLSQAQRRYLKLDVLRLLESYEDNATVNSDRQQREFLSLFENEQVAVYNDLLGLSASKTLPVSEYVSLMRSKIDPKSPVVYIKNIRYQEPAQMGNHWIITISFEKEIDYSNQCGILFSSSEYYGADHKIETTIAWNPQNRECKIRSLSGSVNSSAEALPENYMIFTRRFPNDSLLLCNNEPIKFNYFNQAFLDESSVFSYPKDDDIVLKLVKESEECNMVSMSYHKKHWRLRPHVDFSMGDYYQLDTSNEEMENSSSSMGVGLDIGYVFPSSKKLKWGLFTGVGIQKTKIKSEIQTMEFEVKHGSEADEDGDSYMRQYEMNDTRYTMSVNELYVPLYLDLEYRFNKYFSMYMDLGAKGYMCLGNPTTEFSTRYTAQGKYEKYGGLILDHQSGINGFVSDEALILDNVSTGKFYDYVVDAFVGLGVRVCLYKSLYFDLGGYYQHSLLKEYNCSGNVSVSNPYNTLSSPISYTVRDGEQVKDITEFYSGISKKNFMLNIGLMLKF